MNGEVSNSITDNNVMPQINTVPIIVNGTDVSKLSVSDLSEDLADSMDDDQIDLYLKGKSPEDVSAFEDLAGIAHVSIPLYDEKIKERNDHRKAMGINFGNPSANKVAEVPSTPTVVPTQQTGSVIFGVRK